MSKKVNKEKNYIDVITDEAVKLFKEGKIKNAKDTENFLTELLQPLLQKFLDIELEGHLNTSKYERIKDRDNYRNGHCKEKTVKSKYGEIKLATPRDRLGTFEPIIVEKGQTKLTGFEDKCMSLYAKGMSLRDIEATLNDIYGVKINKDQISLFINAVSENVEKWKNRPLKPLYLFTYCDCLYIPIKGDIKSDKRAIYVVIGVDAHGYKDVLGLWVGDKESSSFWSNIFVDLKNRGVKDILFMTSDGIAGFKNSLEQFFPQTHAQRCVVHLTRNIYQLSPRKEAKQIVQDFKKIYTCTSLELAKATFEDFKNKHQKHKNVVEKVEDFMQYLDPLFELPAEIRKVIYTSNAVESVNSALRKVTRGKGSFPSVESVEKILFLRVDELVKKWNKPIKNFNIIQQQLIEIFGERYTQYLEI